MERKTVILATRNQGKVRELRTLLYEFGFDVQALPEDFPDIEETGATFEENALLKAHAVADMLGMPALADDSGLEVDALNGAPGVFSARYGNDIALLPGESKDERNNRKLLDRMEHVPDERRGARFRCCMAFVCPGEDDMVACGSWEGSIARTPSGSNGFGYDPLFFDPELSMTGAEMTREQKTARSHRGKAVRSLLVRLAERMEHAEAE
ncbi:MAG: RdgB/HAM1 family non-canonical purine NTP pyrophosphatase [Mailhella sp.]|nr:RdgB/HAM1 family non-canonical purine NTP pyrophosphatase [Mailhella sp.]